MQKYKHLHKNNLLCKFSIDYCKNLRNFEA